MAESKRILILAKGFTPTAGGVETYSDEVSWAYRLAGHTVTVLTQTPGKRGRTTRERDGLCLEVINVGPGPQPVAFALMLLSAIRLRLSRTWDCVHSTTWRPAVVSHLVFRSPIRILTIHGREILNARPVVGRIMRRVIAGSDLVICVSPSTLDAALNVLRPSSAKTTWVASYNGRSHPSEDAAPLSPQVGLSPDLRILSLCRLVARKNVANIVRAIAALPENHRDRVILRIAGAGPETDAIRRTVEDAGLAGRIELLGYVPASKVPELYRWANVFVHPQSHVGEGNDFEGFGIAVADAMAYGCAVIAGISGGPGDFIENGVTGMLVNGDSPEEITLALTQLLESPRRLSELGAAARHFAESDLTWARHIEPALNLLRSAGE
ncbi:MAG TPA: glycosyltransferase family 4 protein [Mycobacteriales bacterium]|nr:glycosyltransferase family 4 protein [Mycobacteriales bacterium]